MGKKHRHKRAQKKQVIATPSFESPVCPACGKADKLVEEVSQEDMTPLYECTACWVRFMLEDSRVEIEEDDNDAEAQANMGSVAARDFNGPVKGAKCAICQGKCCEVCTKGYKKEAKKKDQIDWQTEPMFGDVKELTDVSVASRS